MDALSFNGLQAMKELWLHENQIAELPASIFDGLIILEELRLQKNQIVKVDSWQESETYIEDKWLFPFVGRHYRFVVE